MTGRIANRQTPYRASPPGILWVLSLASSGPGKTREDCVHTLHFLSAGQCHHEAGVIGEELRLTVATWPDLARPGLSPKLYDSQPCAFDTNTSLNHHQHFPPTRHSAEHRRPGTGLGSKDTGETGYNRIALSLRKLNQNTWRAQGLWGPGEALGPLSNH